ncbi:MAG: hypothetical protein ACKVQS_08585 [Fimbriimonadaceae bacterium]
MRRDCQGLISIDDHDDDERFLFYRFYLGPVLGLFAILGWGMGLIPFEGAPIGAIALPGLAIVVWMGYAVWQDDIQWRRRLAMACIALTLFGLALGGIRALAGL